MGVFALLNRLFHGPAWLTFLIMGMALGGLALCSFNLLFLFQANSQLIFTYGAMAAFDGGLLQFIELTAWGYLALACFIVVETCREGLLSRIRHARLLMPGLPTGPEQPTGSNPQRQAVYKTKKRNRFPISESSIMMARSPS